MADKSSEENWNKYLNDIAKKYIDGWSYEQIAAHLTKSDFAVKGPSVKFHLQHWKIKRFKLEDDHELLAKRLLHHREKDEEVVLYRFGEQYDQDLIEDYLQRNSVVASAEPLPAHLKVAKRGHGVNGANGNADSPVEHTARPQREDSSSTQHADEGSTKKRKLAALPTRVRSRQDARPSTGGDRSTSPDDREWAAALKEKDEEDEPALSKQITQVAKAIAIIQKESTDLDLADAEVEELLRRLKRFHTVASKTEEREREEDKFTDLSPLQHAAFKDEHELIRLLLDKGANINARGGFGWTALHVAADQGHTKTLKELLLRGDVLRDDVDIDAADDDGKTAFMQAIEKEFVDCALLLFHRNADVDKVTADGHVALHQACIGRYMTPLVALIISKTTQIDKQSEYGNTPLHLAIYSKNWEHADALVEAGANLNLPNKDGRTAVHYACFEAGAKFLLNLVKNEDADWTVAAGGGTTALHLLCQRELCQVVQAVLERLERSGAKDKVLNARRLNGFTPLMVAAYNGSLDTVEMLIRNQADVSLRDIDGDTALIIAIRFGHSEIAKVLIKADSPLEPQYKSRARHKAELQSTRLTQEISPVLLKMAKRFPVASSRYGAQHDGTPRQPSLNDLGIDRARFQAFATQLNQMSYTLEAMGRAANIPTGSMGSGQAAADMASTQSHHGIGLAKQSMASDNTDIGLGHDLMFGAQGDFWLDEMMTG